MINFLRSVKLLCGMTAVLLPGLVWVATNAVPPTVRAAKSTTTHADAGSVRQLIQQLGSDQYYLRRRAEEQLIERGADVFDQLQQAEGHADLEIASRAQYILQRIRIDWIHANDSAEVQAVMHRYGDLSKPERLERMDQLVALADDAGLGALCRIARFDPSQQVARNAALKVMQSNVPPKRATSGVAVMNNELGDGQRAPVQWLRTYAEQLEHPERVFDHWLKLIDEEATRQTEYSSDTEAALVFELIDFHLGLCRDKPQPDAIFESLKRRTELYVQQNGLLRNGLAYAMNWLWENERWEAMGLLEDQYADTFHDERLLVYMSAASRWKQGRDELAEEFAERAYKMVADNAEQRVSIGDLIGEMGRHDWAEREWWFVVEALPVTNIHSVWARHSLTSLRLHDRGEDKEAAQLVREVRDAAEADAKLRRDFMRDPRGSYLLKQAQDYFLACQAATDGNYQLQRKHLESAYRYDQQDADVLIAMYRSPGADKAYRKTTSLRIRKAAHTVQDRINQEPHRAIWYNHWAWLVSNTEGDYQQAVKYSLRSLELSPNSPSYLDTLGRCYYTVGDLEKALEAQREAVQRHPHVKVMRDQLAMIESALAKQQSKRE